MKDYGKNRGGYRRNVTDWIDENISSSDIHSKLSRDGNMRQCILTQDLVDLQPRGSIGYGIEKSGYYMVYQIEVRKDVARFNLLCHQDEKVTYEIRDFIRFCVKTEMHRDYRPDGEWFSKPLHLIKIGPETSAEDIYAFLEEGLRLGKMAEIRMKTARACD